EYKGIAPIGNLETIRIGEQDGIVRRLFPILHVAACREANRLWTCWMSPVMPRVEQIEHAVMMDDATGPAALGIGGAFLRKDHGLVFGPGQEIPGGNMGIVGKVSTVPLRLQGRFEIEHVIDAVPKEGNRIAK